MRYAQLVIGPAGSGKSTYCSALVQHISASNKMVEVVNLDPAAEYIPYDPLVDIRELICSRDAMEDVDLKLGPNGGLLFCMEYLLENREWLREKLGDVDDDYLLFDCPGQIELYTHMKTIKNLANILQKWNFNICAIFLMDAQFMVDGAKFISGTMSALSVMVNLELPQLNVLSKVDILSASAKNQLDNYLEPNPPYLVNKSESTCKWNEKYRALTESIGRLIDEHCLVRFVPLNIKDHQCISAVLLTINTIIQYGEDADVRTHDFDL